MYVNWTFNVLLSYLKVTIKRNFYISKKEDQFIKKDDHFEFLFTVVKILKGYFKTHTFENLFRYSYAYRKIYIKSIKIGTVSLKNK